MRLGDEEGRGRPRAWSGVTIGAVAAIVALCLVAVASAVIATGSGGGSHSTVNHRLAAHFAVFRGSADVAAQPSSASSRAATVVPSSGVNADSAAARSVSTADGTIVTATPGSNGACVASSSDGVTCNLTVGALNGDVVLVAQCTSGAPSGGAVVMGLMPDGVDSVTVTMRGDTSAPVSTPVTANAYHVAVPGVPSDISWTGSDGSHSFAAPSRPPGPAPACD
jgi:hypothetical protein